MKSKKILNSTHEDISQILLDDNTASINLACKNSESAEIICSQLKNRLNRLEFNEKLLKTGRGDWGVEINNKENYVIISVALISGNRLLFTEKIISSKTHLELSNIIAAFYDKLDALDTDSDEEDTSIENIPQHSPTFFKTPTTCRENASKSPSPDNKENVQLPRG